jgi:hypothetical protein
MQRAHRNGRRARLASLAAILSALVGCDSLPGALGPNDDDLLATYSISAWGTTPINHVLVHPVNQASWCTQPADSSRVGGVFDGTYHRNTSFDFRGKAGCYVMFVRFADAPGFHEIRTELEAGEYDYVFFNPVPTVPPPSPTDGSVRIVNAATQHTAAISRIYVDACSPNGQTNNGPAGGVSVVNTQSVAHGQSVTIPMPRTCQMITVVWSNGWYQFGKYTITGSNTLSAGS